MAENTVNPALEASDTDVALTIGQAEPEQGARASRPPRLAERLLAALAHLATLLSVPGLLLALAIWLTQRRRSPFVSQQARQAVLWQILSNLVLAVLVVLLLGVAISQLGAAVTTKASASQGDVTRLFGSLVGLYVVLFVTLIYCCASAVLGALFALLGRSFHYPIISRKRKA